MKEKLLIIGAGGLGRVVSEHADIKYECSFIDDKVDIETEICGIKVIGTTKSLEKFRSQFQNLIVAIGNNKIRERIYKKATELGFSFPNIIATSAYISPYATVGNGCIILNNAVIQNGATVGDGVIINPGVEIHHDCKICNNVLIYTNSVIRTYASIGNRAWIGSTLTISNEVIIPEDAVVENGSTY